MSKTSKPLPLLTPDNNPQRVCSVCGKVSYSRGGVHPQCAEESADAARVKLLKEAQKAESPKEKVANSAALSPWHRLCPKCHKERHIRKQVCDCGHRFS